MGNSKHSPAGCMFFSLTVNCTGSMLDIYHKKIHPFKIATIARNLNIKWLSSVSSSKMTPLSITTFRQHCFFQRRREAWMGTFRVSSSGRHREARDRAVATNCLLHCTCLHSLRLLSCMDLACNQWIHGINTQSAYTWWFEKASWAISN